jgi:hypothetical protein
MALTKIQSLGITDGTIVNADINASAAIASTKLSGSFGITEADMWRITTNKTLTSSLSDFSANLERADTDSFSVLGTGMTQSSGIFTFPSTGYYLINAFATGTNSPSTSQYVELDILITTNNSTYGNASVSYTSIGQASYYFNVFGSHILDVTSTANVKVKFSGASQHASTEAFGSTNDNYTWFQFIKLAET